MSDEESIPETTKVTTYVYDSAGRPVLHKDVGGILQYRVSTVRLYVEQG